ncbi:PREDICTED: uncharacterized protein LOC109225977 [Nicotiana attenuata]|uniref:uncharacterized protein LOC109225977 n=1 Tax=Nicotiana attenuata TaxID=49451 RepID=UPI000905C852|nr:PREDICTED: uncharacterized protein LOC109225977 [Nicotiana attenuata]
MVRAPCCEKVGLNKGKWTAEEDELLVKYIQANGEGSWRSLPKNAATMGTVEEIPGLRGWVEKLLTISPMEVRSWKVSHSRCECWSITTSRHSLARAQEIILSSSSKRKVDRPQDSKDEEERGGNSLVRRLRARRCVISNDEATPPPRPISMVEPEEATLVSSDEATPAAPRDPAEHLFSCGFDNENFGLISEETPLASFPVSVPMEPHLSTPSVVVTAPPKTILTSSFVPTTSTASAKIGSSSGSRSMKQITIEIPADSNLLKKSGQADVWFKPLVGPVEKSKLESHSSLTCMNDIVQSSLKVQTPPFYLM